MLPSAFALASVWQLPQPAWAKTPLADDWPTADLQLVDVRAASETAGGTLPGTTEIPLAVLAESLDAIDRKLPVVVYCASGYRSSIASSLLQREGIANVMNVAGGTSAWIRAGFSVESATRQP